MQVTIINKLNTRGADYYSKDYFDFASEDELFLTLSDVFTAVKDDDNYINLNLNILKRVQSDKICHNKTYPLFDFVGDLYEDGKKLKDSYLTYMIQVEKDVDPYFSEEEKLEYDLSNNKELKKVLLGE